MRLCLQSWCKIQLFIFQVIWGHFIVLVTHIYVSIYHNLHYLYFVNPSQVFFIKSYLAAMPQMGSDFLGFLGSFPMALKDTISRLSSILNIFIEPNNRRQLFSSGNIRMHFSLHLSSSFRHYRELVHLILLQCATGKSR